MAEEFEFPDTGEGVTEGKFLEWLVDVGEEVEEDQSIAEVETDKAVVEIPAPSDGVIDELKAEPGDQVEVGEVIMSIETGEEETGKEETEENAGSETPAENVE
ncbi:MAG: biotin/lipoyl-containing protein, partial [Candidatus Nanohaloarchaea archaeon]